MIKSKVVILMLAMVVVGCATYSEMRKMDKFKETSTAYGRAISWSEFDVASTFMKTKENEKYLQNLEQLKAFKVASYDLMKVVPSSDKSKVVQYAEISYFKIQTLVLKKLNDRQVWSYDDAEKRWLLESGLPEFK